MLPRRLDIIDAVEAVGLAGVGAEAFSAGGAEFVVGLDGTVIIVAAVDDPAVSGVWSSETFRLLGPIPRAVGRRWVGPDPQLIHLFVRVERGVLYLGDGHHGVSGWTDSVLTDCDLRIDPPLSVEVLDRVRPPSTPAALPDLEWLEHVNGDRATALRLFVEGWHPAPGPAAEPVVPSGPVPAALAEFYRLAEGRPQVLGVQNFICPASGLSTDGEGLLLFGHENQGGFEWFLDPAEDDPVVWTVEDPSERQAERERLSGFLIQFSLFEAVMSAPYKAWSDRVPEPMADELTRGLRRVPLKTWMWPLFQTSFYVAPGLVVAEGRNEDEECYVLVGVVHRSLLRPLTDCGIQWQYFEG
ncbi:hypothetical protein [Herbidospora daliensis]|uniref:hypothetical protein n=1 Tax=Herbidospora daliensis TaxID=295585 RepID=UPI000784F28E|nr:hypothetical protein [Herbidospora daliensis]